MYLHCKYLCRKAFRLAFIISLAVVGGYAQQNDNQPKPRDIVPVFETTRPPAEGIGKAINNSSKTIKKTKRPVYKRISSRIDSGKLIAADRPKKNRPAKSVQQPDVAVQNSRQIGITLWQLNEALEKANTEFLIDEKNRKKRYLIPERVSFDTIFQPYDLVRLAVENSRRGYLYIVDQEMTADGSLGNAYLVFPNKRIRGGANLVAPGKPLELPDLKGNPFYFELRPENPFGKKLMAEVLTIIITDQPITNLEIGNEPIAVTEKTLSQWRTKWSGRVEIFEPPDENSAYTKAEREAAAGNGILTSADPLPQTVFLVEGNRSGGALITVPLWYGKN